MRVLCNRCKNIFYTEEHNFCPYCGQRGKLPSEAEYSRSKPLERRNTSERSRARASAEEKSRERRAEEKIVQKKSVARKNHNEEKLDGGLLVGTVKFLVFVAVTLVVFFGGVAGGFCLLSSYTSGNKNVAENIRPIDSFYLGVEQGFAGYPIIATAFPPYMTDNGTDTMKITYFESFNTVYAALKSVSADKYSIDYNILDETKLSAQRLEEIKTDISTKVTGNANLTTGSIVSTKALVSAGGEQHKIKVNFTTICLNNTWYIYDLALVEE